MAKIPRMEPQVAFKPAMMSPTSGEGYESQGKALQKLGKGISDLGSGISSLQGVMDEQDDFDTKLNLAKLANDQNADDAQTYQKFNPDTDDIDNYANNRMQAFENRASSVLENARTPKSQRMAALHIERMRGGVYQRNYGYQSGFDESRRINNTRGLIEQEFSKVAAMPDDTGDEVPIAGPLASEGQRDPNLMGPTQAEGAEVRPTVQPNLKIAAIGKAVQTVESIVKSLPVDDAKKQQLYSIGAQRFMEALGSRKDAKELVDAWLESNRASQPQQQGGVQSQGQIPAGAVPDIQDFSKGRGYGQLAPQQVKHIILHDVSGPGGGRLPKGGTVGAYHITFDDRGIYQEVPFDRRAPHATTFNDKSIAIAHIGYEGEKLSPQAIANGARAVQMVSERYGISPENILRHPELGSAGTRRGSKDPREASWREDVLAYIKANPQQSQPAQVAQQPQPAQAGEAQPEQRSMASRALTFGMPKPQQVAQAPAATQTDAVAAAAPVAPSIKGNLTAYAPQAGASNTNSQQGNYLSSKPGPDGKNEVRTLDDVANGRSQYITLAGNPSLAGKEYTIPRIEYRDPQGKVTVLENVRAVVHDTGSAFKNAPEGRFDIPVAKDVGADVRNANHALWKKAGVEFIPAEKGQQGGTQVAQRGQNQMPGQPQQTAQAAPSFSPFQSRIAEAMMKAKPAIDEAYKRQVSAELKTLEDHALTGGDVNDATFQRVAQRVARSGDPELSARMEVLPKVVEQARALKQLGPQQLAQMERVLEAKLMTEPTNPVIGSQLATLRKTKAATESGIASDPYDWGEKRGVLQPGSASRIEMPRDQQSADALPQQLEARVIARGIMEAKLSEPVPFLNESEKKAIKDYFFDPAVKPQDRLVAMRMFYDALGPRMLPDMKQVFGKDAPEVAQLGWMMSNNASTKAMEDGLKGLELSKVEGFKSRIKADDIQSTTDSLTGVQGAFSGVPGAEEFAVTMARHIYEFRAHEKKLDPKNGIDKTLWEESLNAALGRNEVNGATYGGLSSYGTGWFSSVKVFEPPSIKQGALKEIMGALKSSDFLMQLGERPDPAKAAAAAAGREEQIPATSSNIETTNAKGEKVTVKVATSGPVDRMGRAVPIAVVRSSVPVWIGGSRYMLRSGSDATGQPEYLKAANGDNYVLDLERLRPTLKGRLPAGTFRPERGEDIQSPVDILKAYRERGAGQPEMSDPVGWGAANQQFKQRPTASGIR